MKQQADHDAGARERNRQCAPEGMGDALRRAALRRDRARAISARPSTPALAEHRAEVDRDRRQRGRSRPSTTPSTRWSSSGRKLRRVSAVFFNLTGAHTNEALQKIEMRHGAGAREALERHPSRTSALFRRIDALKKREDALGLTAEQARVLERYHISLRPPRRRARPARQEAAGGDHRAARVARHEVRPERARRREVPTRWCWKGRRISPACPDFLREAAAKAAADRDMPGKHVITLSRSLDRAVPAVLRPPRPSRDRLQGMDRARRGRRGDRQPRDHRRDGGAPGGARQPARLREFRRFPPRRHDGEDARGGDRPAQFRVEAGPRRRPSAKPRRCRR